MLAVYVAIAALLVGLGTLILKITGLIVNITAFMTEIKVEVSGLRKEVKPVKYIPALQMRVGFIEKHLDLSTPEMSNHAAEE